MSVALDAITKALAPPSRLSVAEWGRRHVRLPFSARSPRFDPDASPWLVPVLDAVADNGNREVVCYGAVGSGKTSLYEVLIPYFLVEDPGPILCAVQTEQEAKTWCETRLHPVLDNCEPLQPLMPSDRNAKRKTEVVFPHAFLTVCGANMSSLQSKSIGWVLLDETWIYKQGMIEEARRRTHDRWNSRVLLVSQGGTVDDDMDSAFQATDMAEWQFSCPECGEFQPYKWSQVRWDCERDENDEWIWADLDSSTRYECIHCEHSIADTPANRRGLTNSGHYVSTNTNGLRGHKGFRWSVLAVWWVPWSRLAREWLLAMDAKKTGVLDPFRQFRQKRLALPWQEDMGDARAALTGAGYRKADYFDGEAWDGELHRFFTVDKQRDHFWGVIRAWKPDGSSRLIWEGKLLTWEMITELAGRFKVAPKLVFIDAQYDTAQVYNFCSQGDHTALHGSREGGFTHLGARRGKGGKVSKFYSKVQTASTGSGQTCRYIFLASDKVKDVLAELRNGRGAEWEVPDDASEAYRKQIDSEVKKEFLEGRTKATTMRWVQVRRDNHLWDCEVYQTCAAMMLGLLGGDVIEFDSSGG